MSSYTYLDTDHDGFPFRFDTNRGIFLIFAQTRIAALRKAKEFLRHSGQKLVFFEAATDEDLIIFDRVERGEYPIN